MTGTGLGVAWVAEAAASALVSGALAASRVVKVSAAVGSDAVIVDDALAETIIKDLYQVSEDAREIGHIPMRWRADERNQYLVLNSAAFDLCQRLSNAKGLTASTPQNISGWATGVLKMAGDFDDDRDEDFVLFREEILAEWEEYCE